MNKNLYQNYKEVVVPKLKEELKLSNVMEVPRITKVVLNAGIGRFVKEPHFIENVESTLTRITGQKPVRTKAKKAISNFKIRENQEIGVAVTLRGPKMYHFLEKLIVATFPRIRDFRGISAHGFDRKGNYTIGFKEHIAFPEIKSGEIDKIHGLQIIVNTTAKNEAQGRALLTHLGFPFVQ